LEAFLVSITSEFPKSRRALVNKLCSGVASVNRVLCARPACRESVVEAVEELLGGLASVPEWTRALV
jgi:hypothetical protein